jgi:putative tryptophan/tyrosine transport system substrate-binding protein
MTPTATSTGVFRMTPLSRYDAPEEASMKRREFLGLGLAAAAPTFGVHAQTSVRTIGFLGPALSSTPPISYYRSFITELHDLGFVEGTNLAVLYRPQDDPGRIFAVAAELMRLRPELIVAAGGENALQAVVGASIAVPIVMIAVNYDPIERGYVLSLAQPGRNITGVVVRRSEFTGKQVELLAEAFPNRKRITAFFDAHSQDQLAPAEQAAKALQIEIQPLKLETFPYDFDAAFARASASGAETVLILSSILFTRFAPQIAQLSIQHRLPTMYAAKLYVQAGGLMSYGVDFVAMYRKAAGYVGKILKGANPADLPVELATKFETTVNLKTAKAIGVELPTSSLLRADEVIE